MISWRHYLSILCCVVYVSFNISSIETFSIIIEDLPHKQLLKAWRDRPPWDRPLPAMPPSSWPHSAGSFLGWWLLSRTHYLKQCINIVIMICSKSLKYEWVPLITLNWNLSIECFNRMIQSNDSIEWFNRVIQLIQINTYSTHMKS